MKPSRTTSPTICLAGCAALVLTLVGCGGGDASDADPTVTATVAEGSTTTVPDDIAAEVDDDGSESDADESADATVETEATVEPDGTEPDGTVPASAPATSPTTDPTTPGTEPTTTEPTETAPPVAETPVGQRVRDAATSTLALTSFASVMIAEQDNGRRSERIVALATFDYDALVGSVDFTVVEDDTEDSVVVLADGSSFWLRVRDADLEELPAGTEWITGPAALLRSESAQFEPNNTLGVLAGLLVVDEAEELGADTAADGTPVERFRATVDYDAAYEANDELDSIYSFDLREDEAVMVLDVAIDADGLVREFRAVASSDLAPELSASYELTITAPNASAEAPAAPDAALVATGPEADALRALYFE